MTTPTMVQTSAAHAGCFMTAGKLTPHPPFTHAVTQILEMSIIFIRQDVAWGLSALTAAKMHLQTALC